MVVLVVNHLPADTVLHAATEPFLSAAETLVLVSGVVVGMVFGRRWRTCGPRLTTPALLRRSGTRLRASVLVVSLVALLALLPLATDALTVRPAGGPDLYAGAGPLDLLVLGVSPWQYEVLGVFIGMLAVAPAVLWALGRGWWPAVLAASWALYLLGRETQLHVLPSQSEQHFPLLIWQVLFVHGAVLGWHRAAVERLVRGPVVAVVVLAAALLAAYVRLHELGASPFGMTPADWRAWDREHFSKAYLDPARLGSMVAFAGAAYLVLRRFERPIARVAGPFLLPLGRRSFSVFIVHVLVCLAVATLAIDAGLLVSTAVSTAALVAIWAIVRTRAAARWLPS